MYSQTRINNKIVLFFFKFLLFKHPEKSLEYKNHSRDQETEVDKNRRTVKTRKYFFCLNRNVNYLK